MANGPKNSLETNLHIVSWFMTELQCSGGKTVFSVSGAGSNGTIYGEKNEYWLLPHPMSKKSIPDGLQI